MSYTERLEELVGIDSGSGDVAGLRLMADRVGAFLDEAGMTVERVPAGGPDAVVGRVRGTGRGRVLLAGHLDTVARSAPAKLAPAVDAPLTGWALAQHDPDLLVRLAAAYYIDDAPYGRRHNDGVRDHDRRWSPRLPRRSAHYLGPFAPIFAALPLARSAAFLNELLNHAARVRDSLLGADDDERSSRGVVLRIDGSARM